MSGIFGGSKKQKSVEIKLPAGANPYTPTGIQAMGDFVMAQMQQMGTAQTPTKSAIQDANKGATDLEKLTGKKQRTQAFGAAMTGTNTMFSNDTTLASGSLLSLGSSLG